VSVIVLEVIENPLLILDCSRHSSSRVQIPGLRIVPIPEFERGRHLYFEPGFCSQPDGRRESQSLTLMIDYCKRSASAPDENEDRYGTRKETKKGLRVHDSGIRVYE